MEPRSHLTEQMLHGPHHAPSHPGLAIPSMEDTLPLDLTGSAFVIL